MQAGHGRGAQPPQTRVLLGRLRRHRNWGRQHGAGPGLGGAQGHPHSPPLCFMACTVPGGPLCGCSGRSLPSPGPALTGQQSCQIPSAPLLCGQDPLEPPPPSWSAPPHSPSPAHQESPGRRRRQALVGGQRRDPPQCRPIGRCWLSGLAVGDGGGPGGAGGGTAGIREQPSHRPSPLPPHTLPHPPALSHLQQRPCIPQKRLGGCWLRRGALRSFGCLWRHIPAKQGRQNYLSRGPPPCAAPPRPPQTMPSALVPTLLLILLLQKLLHFLGVSGIREQRVSCVKGAKPYPPAGLGGWLGG